ncbi:MAG: DUF4349 domain-containing protein [Mariprofundaceae bacterium]|nr:DUF4349 domain-containing protein [Mariprofundaceae bacterium]
MIKPHNVFLLLTLMLCLSTPAFASLPSMAMNSSFTLKVDDKEAVMDRLVLKAEAVGGYFLVLSDQKLILNIPQPQADRFIQFAIAQGRVLTQTQNSDDIHTQLMVKESMLKSKQTMLKKYMTVLKESDAAHAVSVEQALGKLVYQIEGLKGDIKLMRHRLDFARISFHFRFRDRTTPSANQASSFPWLNRMKLPNLLESFQ